MMTTKDAMNKVNAYIEETAAAIIAGIEADICAKAENGTTYIDYMFKAEHIGKVHHRVIPGDNPFCFTENFVDASSGLLKLLLLR